MSVLFRNSQKALNVLPGDVVRLAEFILAQEAASEKEVSVLFVGDDEISDLNAKYLSREGPTDVLAFPMNPADDPASLSASAALGPLSAGQDDVSAPCCPPLRGRQAALVGDVVVSAERALDYAAKHRLDPAEELSLYLVHGILHLMGYDDANARDRRKMRKREQELIEEARRRGLLLRLRTSVSWSRD